MTDIHAFITLTLNWTSIQTIMHLPDWIIFPDVICRLFILQIFPAYVESCQWNFYAIIGYKSYNTLSLIHDLVEKCNVNIVKKISKRNRKICNIDYSHSIILRLITYLVHIKFNSTISLHLQNLPCIMKNCKQKLDAKSTYPFIIILLFFKFTINP